MACLDLNYPCDVKVHSQKKIDEMVERWSLMCISDKNGKNVYLATVLVKDQLVTGKVIKGYENEDDGYITLDLDVFGYDSPEKKDKIDLGFVGFEQSEPVNMDKPEHEFKLKPMRNILRVKATLYGPHAQFAPEILSEDPETFVMMPSSSEFDKVE